MASIIQHPLFWKSLQAIAKPAMLLDALKLIPERNKALKYQWSKDKLNQMQMQKLKQLIDYAFAKSEYYISLRQENHLLLNNANSINNFYSIPTLTPEKLVNSQDKIWIPEVMKKKNSRQAYITSSSGTSGYEKEVFHLKDVDFPPTAAIFTRFFDAWLIKRGKNVLWLSWGNEEPFIAYHTGWHLYQFISPLDIVKTYLLFAASALM